MPGYVRFQSLQGERCGKLLLAVALLVGGFQRVAFAASPVGLWYAEGGAAEVEIRPCSDGLCGRVVWLRSPIGDDGCELRDDNNPDPMAHSKTIIGLVVFMASNRSMLEADSGGAGRFTIRSAAGLTRAMPGWRAMTGCFSGASGVSSSSAGPMAFAWSPARRVFSSKAFHLTSVKSGNGSARTY